MKKAAPRIPPLRHRRQRRFRREHSAAIEQKLEMLHQVWEVGQPGIRAKHDPGVAEAAMWLCDYIGWPRPPWLQKLAAKFPVDMGRVDVGEAGKVIFRRKRKSADSRLGRRSYKTEVRKEAQRELKRGYPGMDLASYAKWLRSRLYPDRDEDEPPTLRTMVDHISSRPSLWERHVKPRQRRP
jgi:hypothetical protein